MNTTAQILTAARELIADPERWTQKAFARDRYGVKVRATDPEADCWCLRGAVQRVSQDALSRCLVYETLMRVLDERDLGPAAGYEPVALFNDTKSHAEVLELIDQAIVKVSP